MQPCGHYFHLRRGQLNRLSDPLTNQQKQILDNRHNELTTYGIGKEFKKEEWKSLADQLLRKQIILKDEQYGSLKITSDAKPLLKGMKEFWGFIPEIKSKTKSNLFSRKTTKGKANTNEYDEILFQELRTLRKELADKTGIPPYIAIASACCLPSKPEAPVIMMTLSFNVKMCNFLKIKICEIKRETWFAGIKCYLFALEQIRNFLFPK